MADEKSVSYQQLERYIQSYLALEVQDPEEALTDPQLATAIPLIADRVAGGTGGAIIDIGCGTGSLLARLLTVKAFSENKDWIYVGIDTEDKISEAQRVARKVRMSRKAEFLEISDFHSEWPKVHENQVVICRNVFHEIKIDETSILLNYVAANLNPGNMFLIQDLMCLPVSERNSACWIPDNLAVCLTEIGYSQVHFVAQVTRSGNSYFNLSATAPVTPVPSLQVCRATVRAARQRQWSIWVELEKEENKALSGRSELIEALDLDLQVTALTRQLRDEGVLRLDLDDEFSRRVRASAFTKRVAEMVESGLIAKTTVDEYVHFRERGEQLTILEEFLRSSKRIAVVHGGIGTGKTTLVRRLLSNRAYGKAAIVVDGRRTKGYWPFVEEFFSQIGLNLSPEQLSVLSNISFDNMEVSFRHLLNAYAHKIIIFYDSFSEILDSNSEIADQMLERLLCLIAGKQGIKLILASRSDVVPARLQFAASEAPTAARVGRYGTEQTVVNILDDHFDRASNGISEYPEALISAIDRHPLITLLAAQTLQKFGSNILLDSNFVSELRNRLRDDLWTRLVDDTSRPAVVASSQLRVPVPMTMLETLTTRTSIQAATSGELLYSLGDSRWGRLWSTLGIFRLRSVGDPSPAAGDINTVERPEPVDHSHIASIYRSLYRLDDDPKWIRESYFHIMIAGGDESRNLSKSLGSYYFDELIASGDYEFVRNRDYKSALNLYTIAMEVGNLRETAAMRRASCLIRVGNRQLGEEVYKKLCATYPNSIGIRTSHIDALLFRHDYRAALTALERYEFRPDASKWIAYQWGRTHLGLEKYDAAIDIFRTLVDREDADSHFYVHLARAHQQFGALQDAIDVLRRGARRFVGNIAIMTALGADLERAREDDEAKEILEALFRDRSDNVRAALSLVRIHLRNGDLASARQILRTAEKSAPDDLEYFVIAARVEVMLFEGRPDLAVEFLEKHVAQDPTLVGMLLDAYVQLANAEADTHKRAGILNTALNLKGLTQFAINAPVQVNRARLALAARDASIFSEAVGNLKKTKIATAEIAKLERQWTT
jgi:tetratricopeptide (TPR) repeat protein